MLLIYSEWHSQTTSLQHCMSARHVELVRVQYQEKSYSERNSLLVDPDTSHILIRALLYQYVPFLETFHLHHALLPHAVIHQVVEEVIDLQS